MVKGGSGLNSSHATTPRCACGCGGAITVLPRHRSRGMPRHLPGHGKSAMERVVEEIRDEGFLTALDVRDALGCSASKVSRLVREEKLVAAGDKRCGKRVVRYFSSEAVEALTAPRAGRTRVDIRPRAPGIGF